MAESVASVGMIMELKNNPISTQVDLQQALLDEVISNQDKYLFFYTSNMLVNIALYSSNMLKVEFRVGG